MCYFEAINLVIESNMWLLMGTKGRGGEGGGEEGGREGGREGS